MDVGIKELAEKLMQLLANGKKITYYYGDEDTAFSHYFQWAHVIGGDFSDGDNLILKLSNGYEMWPIAVSDNDVDLGEFLTNLSYYDELFEPQHVMLGTNKRSINDN